MDNETTYINWNFTVGPDKARLVVAQDLMNQGPQTVKQYVALMQDSDPVTRFEIFALAYLRPLYMMLLLSLVSELVVDTLSGDTGTMLR